MSYTITYHQEVVTADIPKLSAPTKKRVRAAIEQKLTTQPELFGKPLRKSLKGYRKLRVGDYRVIFAIQKKTVRVLMIAHRSIVYGRVPKRNF